MSKDEKVLTEEVNAEVVEAVVEEATAAPIEEVEASEQDLVLQVLGDGWMYDLEHNTFETKEHIIMFDGRRVVGISKLAIEKQKAIVDYYSKK